MQGFFVLWLRFYYTLKTIYFSKRLWWKWTNWDMSAATATAHQGKHFHTLTFQCAKHLLGVHSQAISAKKLPYDKYTNAHITAVIALLDHSSTLHKTIAMCNDPVSCYSWLILFYHPRGLLFCQLDWACAASWIHQTKNHNTLNPVWIVIDSLPKTQFQRVPVGRAALVHFVLTKTVCLSVWTNIWSPIYVAAAIIIKCKIMQHRLNVPL